MWTVSLNASAKHSTNKQEQFSILSRSQMRGCSLGSALTPLPALREGLLQLCSMWRALSRQKENHKRARHTFNDGWLAIKGVVGDGAVLQPGVLQHLYQHTHTYMIARRRCGGGRTDTCAAVMRLLGLTTISFEMKSLAWKETPVPTNHDNHPTPHPHTSIHTLPVRERKGKLAARDLDEQRALCATL